MTSTAFLYLVGASWRNRLHTMASRLRRPRYAAALVAGIAYLWVFLLRPMGGGVAVPELVSQPTEMIVTVLGVLTLMGSWVFGADSSALAFTQAEVSLLFPAPLTRRSLILYKLLRAQFVVLVNAMIWVYVLRRGGTALPPLLRAISLWMLFSTLNFHRLGAALVRASWREHRGAGVRRQFWSTALFAILAAMLFATLFEHRRALTWSAGPGPFFTALGQILDTAPASWALWPVHIVVAPTFAATTAEWLRTIGPALAMLVLHAWWVLRADTAFEDAAIVASAERARRMESMRSRRTLAASAPPRATATLSLASAGHPAFAVFWKNILCLRRTAQLRVFLGPLAMAVVLGAAFSTDGDALAVVATSALLLAGMLLVFGGRLIRNDLRQDMQNLALLKALPIKPSDLMLAEVSSSALPMAAVQFSLLLIAFIAAAFTDYTLISGSVRLGGLFASPMAVLALNLALMTIQNGTAVLFPSWIRLGATVSTGVEALGQNVIATTANLASLSVGLVIPALLGYVTMRALGGPAPFPIAAGVVVASMVLAAETYATLGVLGRAFARAEPYSASP